MCLASALDIIEAGRPPRATFVDYPLGHTAGKPFDERDQLGILRATLRGFETLTTPGDIQILPNAWGSVSGLGETSEHAVGAGACVHRR